MQPSPSVDLVEQRPVWPVPGPNGPGPDYDPLASGPMVLELGAGTRDALADLTDVRLPAVAVEWAQAEEFELAGSAASDLRPLVTELRQLARTAKACEELLYCWVAV